jgi:L,D-transpeptidase catalytic domain
MRSIFNPVSLLAFLVFSLFVTDLRAGSAPHAKHNINFSGNRSAVTASKNAAFDEEVSLLYDQIELEQYGLAKKAFEYAYKGYLYLLEHHIIARNNILTICDFSQSSKNKRLYILDLDQKKVLINTYVAHGRNSGTEFAYTFSNNSRSHKSSLGFYVTENTYFGDHGLSLKIHGLERGFNDRANGRAIVVHGSDYVGDDYLQGNPFNGRSFGCPAVPSNESDAIIETIKDGSCFFIYHPTKKYIAKSKILNS